MPKQPADREARLKEGKEGVVTRSIVPPNDGLILGHKLLVHAYGHEEYDASLKYRSCQQTVRRVMAVVKFFGYSTAT